MHITNSLVLNISFNTIHKFIYMQQTFLHVVIKIIKEKKKMDEEQMSCMKSSDFLQTPVLLISHSCARCLHHQVHIYIHIYIYIVIRLYIDPSPFMGTRINIGIPSSLKNLFLLPRSSLHLPLFCIHFFFLPSSCQLFYFF